MSTTALPISDPLPYIITDALGCDTNWLFQEHIVFDAIEFRIWNDTCNYKAIIPWEDWENLLSWMGFKHNRLMREPIRDAEEQERERWDLFYTEVKLKLYELARKFDVEGRGKAK